MNATPSLQKQYALGDIPSLVEQVLIPLCLKKTIFTLEGPLGAGKTTLVRTFLQRLGVEEIITSPTFTYVNTYSANNKTIYHFDLYRLESVDEFIAMGFDEYLAEKNAYCFIEWPAVIEKLLSRKEFKGAIAKIVLNYDENELEKRRFDLSLS